MSSTTQHPICATCNLHKCSPFSGCLGTTVGDKQGYCTCPRSTACPTCTLERCPSPFGICDGQEICIKHCTGHMEKAHPGANPFGIPYDQYAESRRKEEAANAARYFSPAVKQGPPRRLFQLTKEELWAEIATLRDAFQRIHDERDDLLRKNKSLKSVVADLLAEKDE